MTHDRPFPPGILIGGALLALVVMDNMTATLRARHNTMLTAAANDAERTTTIRKNLESLRLPLHEAKYWKKIP